jgi:hypothetical protein
MASRVPRRLGRAARPPFEQLQSWTESDNEGIRFFSGIATYRKSVRVAGARWQKDRLFLELGDLAEIAEVTLNGKRLGLVWLPPYRIEISGRREGRRESTGDPRRQSLGQPAQRRFAAARVAPFHPQQPRPDSNRPDLR